MLIASMVVGSLVVAGLLAILSLRSRLAALLGVAGLAAIALVAAFTEPFVAPVASVLTILGALTLGTWFADYLVRLRPGDKVVLEGKGKVFEYRVSETLVADPSDRWAKAPVRGRDMVSLQTCTPIPTFEKRLVVRADRS